MKAVADVARVRVRADGERLSGEALARLGRMRVAQGLSLPAQCELSFFGGTRPGPGAPVPVADRLRPGARLELQDSEQSEWLFGGEVTAVEQVFGQDGGRVLRVRAYDALHRLRKRQPVRSHVQVTFADLAREVVGELGLRVDAQAEGPVRARVMQFDQSDWELLRQEGARTGLYFVLRDETLHLLTLEGQGEAMELAYGRDLLEARSEVSTERTFASVAVNAWSPHHATWHREEATRPRSGRSVQAAAPADAVGGSGELRLTDELSAEPAGAAAVAQATLDRAAGRAVVLEGVADGTAGLRPGRPIRVRGLSSRVDGRYVVTETCHRIDGDSGYTTRFTTAPPEPPSRPRGTAATVGVVSAVEDPEEAGRVRVTLPAYEELETDWLEVVSPAAGTDHGLTAVPSAEDRVLVLLPKQDPAQGLVLGGLYGRDGPTDDGVEDGTVRRYTLRTPEGQTVRLDDEAGTFHLENGSGSRLEVGPDRAVLHAATGLVIEAPGNRISIRGGSIDFSRA